MTDDYTDCFTEAINLLDQAASLVAREVMKLREEYWKKATASANGKVRFSFSVTMSGSVLRIRWVKMYPRRLKKDGTFKVFPDNVRAAANGNYTAKCFGGVPERDIRLIMEYEKKLSVFRDALRRNRRIRFSLSRERTTLLRNKDIQEPETGHKGAELASV